MTLLITEADAKALLSIETAIPVVEETFRMAGERTAHNPERTHLYTEKGYMKIGSGMLSRKNVMGFKVVANAGKSTPLNLLFDTDTAELLAVVQSAHLSRCRTCAVAAVAIRHLSPPGARTLGLYGSGRLAEGHLEAAALARDLGQVKVYSRTPANRDAFAARMSERLGLEVLAVGRPEESASDVDILMAITNTEVPVVSGDWLTGPGLVLSAGANHWYERELDERVISRASLIVVDEKKQARLECGDLLWAIDHGIGSWDAVEEIGDVITGRVKLPDLSASTIVFESQGLGIHDVAISLKAYELAKATGLGRELEIAGPPAVKQVIRP